MAKLEYSQDMTWQPRLKIIGLTISCIILVAGLVVSLTAVRKPQRALPVAASYSGGAILSVSSPTSSVYTNQEFSLTVNLNTQTHKVTAAAVYLTFPSANLEVKSATIAAFLPTPLIPPQIVPGSVSFTLGSGSTPKSGTGPLVILTFKALRSQSAPVLVDFNPQTQVAGIDPTGKPISESILDAKTGATVTIKDYLPGDLNHDGKVDIFDYNPLVADFGKTGTPGFVPADIDKNGKIDIFDYNILVANFGKIQ